MKKKHVVLCELCEEDRLAAIVVHWGLCGEHVEGIGAAAVSNGTSKRGGRRRAGKGRKHEKCGRTIDPRGWKKHVAACKGKA